MTLKEQISVINDEYLLTISNTGLLKRAHREASECEIDISISDQELFCKFIDGTIVKIKDTLGKYECSCPSRTICKHVLIALIKGSKTVETKVVVGDFSYLLDISQEQLIKEYGKKNYNNVITKIMRNEKCDIKENSILLINMPNGFSVQFLSNKESVCNCKKNNCLHKLEAIMQYCLFKEGTLKYQIMEVDKIIDEIIVEDIINFIAEIFQIGLFRLPSYYSERCLQFSLVCHGEGLGVFEKIFTSLSQDFLLYEQKNVGFSKYSLLKNLSQIYLQANILLNNKNIKHVERLKQQYWDLPKIEIYGIGLTTWYTKSGYGGVTAIFYCPNIKKNVTFSLSRKAENELEALKNIEIVLLTSEIWNTSIHFQKISIASFALLDGKISDNYRLSSSEKSNAVLINEFSTLESVNSIMYEDFSLLSDLFSIDPTINKSDYVILKVNKIENGYFDKINQIYRCDLIDKFSNCISLTVKYNKINQEIIDNLEYLEKENISFEAMTVQITIVSQDSKAIIFPIAIWNEGKIYNLNDTREKLYESSV